MEFFILLIVSIIGLVLVAVVRVTRIRRAVRLIDLDFGMRKTTLDGILYDGTTAQIVHKEAKPMLGGSTVMVWYCKTPEDHWFLYNVMIRSNHTFTAAIEPIAKDAAIEQLRAAGVDPDSKVAHAT